MDIRVDWNYTTPRIDIDRFLDSQDEDDGAALLAPAFAVYVLSFFEDQLKSAADPMDMSIETYVTDDGEYLFVDSSGSWVSQLTEILELALWVNSQLAGPHFKKYEVEKVYALLSDDWSSYIGSDYDNVTDEITDTFTEGEEAQYARDWLDNTDQALPEGLEDYFDFQAYGESLLNDLSTITFSGTVYVLDH